MMAIRRLEPPVPQAAAEALSALHARAFDGPDGRWGRGWSAVELSALAEAPGVIFLAADKEASLRGLAIVRAIGEEAEILTIGTCPTARRAGVASALLSDATRRLRSLGVADLFLEVGERNTGAIALYERAGFKQTAIRANYYTYSEGGRDNALVFKLKIN